MYGRALGYKWLEGQIYKVILGGIIMLCLPSDRAKIITRLHQQYGHFGVHFWWQHMGDDIAKVVKICTACAKVRTRFKDLAVDLSATANQGCGIPMGNGLCGLFAHFLERQQVCASND